MTDDQFHTILNGAKWGIISAAGFWVVGIAYVITWGLAFSGAFLVVPFLAGWLFAIRAPSACRFETPPTTA